MVKTQRKTPSFEGAFLLTKLFFWGYIVSGNTIIGKTKDKVKRFKFIFKRSEAKYRLSPKQFKLMIDGLDGHMVVDEFGETTIQSLYFDTDNWLLIRRSIEKPVYKEKLRARSYNLAAPNKQIFLELKKKYDKIVYKRRISLKEKDLISFLNSDYKETDNQIEKEIKYFNKFYGGLKPSMMLLYDRTAYVQDDSDLRITFDKNVRYRIDKLDLCSSLDGECLFDDSTIIMEIKASRPYPKWLISILNQNKIYKTSFSKYGTAYKKVLAETNKLMKLEAN